MVGSEDSSSESSDDTFDDPTVDEAELEQEEEENDLFEEYLAAEGWQAVMGGEGRVNAPTKNLVSMRDAASASDGFFEQLGSGYVKHLNRENAKLVYSHVAKAAAKGESVHEALRTAGSLSLDMMLDKDDVSTNVSNARRQRAMQVETRPRFLFDLAVEERGLTQAMVDQGLKRTSGKRVRIRGAAKERVYSVPRGLTLLKFEELYTPLLALADKNDFSVSAVRGAPLDDPDFATMLIRIPPVTSASSATAATARIKRLVHAVVAPFYDSRAVLRSTAFHLRLAGLMKPSRGTEQSYWGYSSSSARERALCAVAYGVNEDRFVGDHPFPHPSLRIPTLVHANYVSSGEITLADRLQQLVVAQHKHLGELVSSGPWSGACADIFGNGIESLGEACSSALLLLLAEASPEHARSFLDTVRKPVRLGGKQSLAMHPTMAFYSTGPFLAEAESYLEQVLKDGNQGKDQDEARPPPGVLLQEAASDCITKHWEWAKTGFEESSRTLLEKERASTREPLDTMQACFVHGTPAAARDALNDLAARGRINKTEVCTLAPLPSNWACTFLCFLSLTAPPSLASGRPPAGCRRPRVWIDQLHAAAHQGVRGHACGPLVGAARIQLGPHDHSERRGD